MYLQRFDVAVQICYALLHFPFMSSTHAPEGRSPHRHFFVAVRRKIGRPLSTAVTFIAGYLPPFSDGSVLTTPGAANPTLTIVALALRQAKYLSQQMKAGNA